MLESAKVKDNWNPYKGNAPALESSGNILPPLLEDVIDVAIMCNHHGFKEDNHIGDEWQATNNTSDSLTHTLKQRGYAGARVYVSNSENDTGLIEEDHGQIVDFVPYRVDSDFSGGNLLQEEGWEVGLRIRIKKPNDSAADKNGYIYKTISFNDPHFGMELHEDRQRRTARKASEVLLGHNVGATALAQYNYLNGYLQDSSLRYRKVRNIGRAAKKLLNSKACRNDQGAQQSVGSMIMHAYGPGRYQFAQSLVTEFVAGTEQDDQGLPNFEQQKISKRSRELVDGNLKSVIILPDFRSRRKTLVPNFVVEPIGDSGRSLIVPLEHNNSMAWMSD